MPRATRLAAAGVVAALAAAYTIVTAARDPLFISDFDQIWYAAQALLARENPYRAVISGFGEHDQAPFPLFYPLPAIVAGVPFAFLPLIAARAAFAGASLGVLAFLLTRRGLWALAALLSAPAFLTISLVQWSGWLACTALVPWFGWVLACKPNAGVAVLAAGESNRSVLIGVAMSGVLVAISFAIHPAWFQDWISAIRGQPHFRPYVLRPGGILMLLALLRWRRPEARWLAATALVPGTPGPQEALVFFAAAHSFRELLVLGLLSHGAMWAAFPARQAGDFYSYVDVAAVANIALIYLPALAVVLRRPNDGPVPAVVEQIVSRLADRLRRQ